MIQNRISILGPKLFLIYINDLCNVSILLKFILFADDTNIFYSADSLELFINTISQVLSKLHNWLAVNKLSLNINKLITGCTWYLEKEGLLQILQ